jgi:hypothetical protein
LKWKIPVSQKVLGFVNLQPSVSVYEMSATVTPNRGNKSRPPADEQEGMMTREHATFWNSRTLTTVQASRLDFVLAVYPLRQ